MKGWSVLAWGGVCACGAVLFLGLVADAIEAVQVNLDRLERQAKKEAERRQEAVEGEEAITAEAA